MRLPVTYPAQLRRFNAPIWWWPAPAPLYRNRLPAPSLLRLEPAEFYTEDCSWLHFHIVLWRKSWWILLREAYKYLPRTLLYFGLTLLPASRLDWLPSVCRGIFSKVWTFLPALLRSFEDFLSRVRYLPTSESYMKVKFLNYRLRTLSRFGFLVDYYLPISC